MGKRPTITDIASRAGVSIGAVSYALNGRPGVSAATREKILAIAEEIGWRPSVAARSLASSSSATSTWPTAGRCKSPSTLHVAVGNQETPIGRCT